MPIWKQATKTVGSQPKTRNGVRPDRKRSSPEKYSRPPEHFSSIFLPYYLQMELHEYFNPDQLLKWFTAPRPYALGEHVRSHSFCKRLKFEIPLYFFWGTRWLGFRARSPWEVRFLVFYRRKIVSDGVFVLL